MSIRAIQPLSAAFRHAQVPAGFGAAPQFYEWWYFEVEFFDDDGRPFRVITSFHYPHGLDSRRVLAHQDYKNYRQRYGDDPRHYAGIASYVVDVRETKNVALFISRFRRADIGNRVTVSRPGDPLVALRFGNSSFIENADGSFTLTIAQKGLLYVSPGITRDLELSMVAHFHQHTPGFQPPNGVLISQGGVDHHWACVMPNPTVTIDGVRVLRQRRRGWTSLCSASGGNATLGGYHDHQWGADLFYEQIARWSWGRVPLEDGACARKLLFFDVAGTASGNHPDPVLVEVPNATTLPVALAPIAGAVPFQLIGPIEHINFADGCRLGITGQNVPYHRFARIRGTNSAAVQRDVTIEHRLGENVDTWPFYLRFAPEVAPVPGGPAYSSISEIMQASRMTLPKTQKTLARSELITVTET